jgi:DNA polymerase III psi subunit
MIRWPNLTRALPFRQEFKHFVRILVPPREMPSYLELIMLLIIDIYRAFQASCRRVWVFKPQVVDGLKQGSGPRRRYLRMTSGLGLWCAALVSGRQSQVDRALQDEHTLGQQEIRVVGKGTCYGSLRTKGDFAACKSG